MLTDAPLLEEDWALAVAFDQNGERHEQRQTENDTDKSKRFIHQRFDDFIPRPVARGD